MTWPSAFANELGAAPVKSRVRVQFRIQLGFGLWRRIGSRSMVTASTEQVDTANNDDTHKHERTDNQSDQPTHTANSRKVVRFGQLQCIVTSVNKGIAAVSGQQHMREYIIRLYHLR